jgi:protein TonB
MPRFVYQPKPDYPFLAQRQGWEGTVVLEIELLADGTIGEVNIVTSSGHLLLDDVALKTVQTWRHAPVQRNGTPVTRRAYLPIRFQLD